MREIRLARAGILIALEGRITVGCSASLRGTLVDSPGKGQEKEFRVEAVEVLGASDAEVRSAS